MRRVLVGLSMMLASGGASLLLAPVAHAACPAPYTTDSLLEDMIGVEGAMRTGKTADAAAGAKKLEAGLPCLDSGLPSQIAGRAYRAIGGGYVYGGDAARGKAWLTTAAELESGFEYGLEDLPSDHPVRGAWDEVRMSSPSDPVPVAGGQGWAPGKVLLDGRSQSGPPQARGDRPHLLQIVDGASVRGWLIEGNGIPPEALAAPAVAAVPVATGKAAKTPKPPKEPKVVAVAPVPAPVAEPTPEPEVAPEPAPEPKAAKEPKPEKQPAVAEAPEPEEPKVAKEPKPEKAAKENKVETTSDGTVMIDRQRPWQKTPLLVGGGAMLAGAGLLYWQSSVHHDAFLNDPGVDTADEVLAEQSATNTFFLASGALLAVGAGTLTWGVVLDGTTPLPSFGFSW